MENINVNPQEVLLRIQTTFSYLDDGLCGHVFRHGCGHVGDPLLLNGGLRVCDLGPIHHRRCGVRDLSSKTCKPISKCFIRMPPLLTYV